MIHVTDVVLESPRLDADCLTVCDGYLKGICGDSVEVFSWIQKNLPPKPGFERVAILIECKPFSTPCAATVSVFSASFTDREREAA